MTHKPSFIYFDIGGVLIRDLSKTDEWQKIKTTWGITVAQDQEFEKFYTELENQFCVGRTTSDFTLIVNERYGLNLPENYSLNADLVNHFRPNPSIFPIVNKVIKQFRTGLLTNMYPDMLETIYRNLLMPKLVWNTVIDSSVERVKKPDAAIYKLAEERAGCRGVEILFVENSVGNIEVAKSFGWQTFLYDPADSPASSQKLAELLELKNLS